MATHTVSHDECWVCGTDQSLTSHHTLPQHLNPKHNFVVPVCVSCHEKITTEDVTGLYAFGGRIISDLGQIKTMVKKFQQRAESHNKIKIKRK